MYDFSFNDGQQAPIVQRLDNAIHRINHYPADSVVCFVNTSPLDSVIQPLNNRAQDDKEIRVALLTLFLGALSKFTRGHFWTPQQQRKIFDHRTLAFRPSCTPKKNHKHNTKHRHKKSSENNCLDGPTMAILKPKPVIKYFDRSGVVLGLIF